MKKNPVNGTALVTGLRRVPRVALIAILVAGGLAGILYVLAEILLGGNADGPTPQWNERYEQHARGLARAAEATLAQYIEAIDAVGADARVREALVAADPVRLETLAAELEPTLPHVLKLRLLPATVRDPDMESRPPLSFASISMIRRAREAGKAPPAEAHLAGTDDEHIVFLSRIETPLADGRNARLLGFVHLAVDPDVVRELVSTAAPADAYVEIRQGVAVRLAASGRPPPDDVPAAIVPIAGTTLAVSFKPQGESAPGVKPGFPPVLIGLGVAVVLALVGFVIWNGRRAQVRVGAIIGDDAAVTYQGAIKAILEGAHPGLEQLLPRAREDGVVKPAAIEIAELERAGGDDVTQFNAELFGDNEDPTVPRTDEGVDEFLAVDAAAPDAAAEAVTPVPASVFRSYDIRGIVGETLTEDGVYQIGRALGAEADARDQRTVVVARDGRHSSESLMEALVRALLESGRDVLDIGLVPTPVLYFATHFLDARSGVMITGSHNAAHYNGLKIVLDGETLSGEAIQAVRRRVEEQDFIEGTGSLQATDIVAEYIRRISEEIPVTLGHALKIVVDCANGVPGVVAPDILRAIGHDVIELFCDVDGDFPNHHPDPSQPENLSALIDAVLAEGADLGLAFDGDGDRLGVVDGAGKVIWPDRQMILFARDILSRHPGAKIIFDVKCSRQLADDIAAHGGEPIMAKSGHSLIKGMMLETGALLAGEMSGHIFFKDRWYGFDDAIYSAARLLEIIVNSGQSPADLFDSVPGGIATPELRLDMAEDNHTEFMRQVLAAADFAGGEVNTLDGLRVDFPQAFGLIRPSKTSPCLILRFEGDDEAALAGVQEKFRALLHGIDASLDLPF
ncbi:MAG: phosphomannomutase/phosphoglucomutase [Gammaproteobacteria bacterium]